MEILKTKDKVRTLLQNVAGLRDNDNKLIANVWRDDIETKGFDFEDMSARELLYLLGNGQLAATESITRARRKVQEECKELRGSSYGKRKEHTEKVKSDLGYKV
jgi:hypothetical protein